MPRQGEYIHRQTEYEAIGNLTADENRSGTRGRMRGRQPEVKASDDHSQSRSRGESGPAHAGGPERSRSTPGGRKIGKFYAPDELWVPPED